MTPPRIWFALLSIPLTLVTVGCALDISSGHLRSGTPRFTTFTTENPQVMANCITQRWSVSGRFSLITQKTDTGYALLTTQKLDTHEKQPMAYIAIDTSREGSSVRLYTNNIDEMADRSLINIIQGCH